MKDAEKSMAGSSESYSTFKSRLEKLPANIVVIGSHAHTDNRKEKVLLLSRLLLNVVVYNYVVFGMHMLCASVNLLGINFLIKKS